MRGGGCYLDVNKLKGRELCKCLGHSMYTERDTTFLPPFIFVHTKVTPPSYQCCYLSFLIPPCIVAVTSCPSYLAWKGEEHWTQKTQTYTTNCLENITEIHCKIPIKVSLLVYVYKHAKKVLNLWMVAHRVELGAVLQIFCIVCIFVVLPPPDLIKKWWSNQWTT